MLVHAPKAQVLRLVTGETPVAHKMLSDVCSMGGLGSVVCYDGSIEKNTVFDTICKLPGTPQTFMGEDIRDAVDMSLTVGRT